MKNDKEWSKWAAEEFALWRAAFGERDIEKLAEQFNTEYVHAIQADAFEEALDFMLHQADRYRRNYDTRLAVDAVVSSAENFRMWAREQGLGIKYK